MPRDDAPTPVGQCSYLEAISTALAAELEADERVVFLGQDVAAYGGAFKLSKGLARRFPGRVLNTPIAESGAIGGAIGMALVGDRPIVEMQFADFVSCGFNQIVNGGGEDVLPNGARPSARHPSPLRRRGGRGALSFAVDGVVGFSTCPGSRSSPLLCRTTRTVFCAPRSGTTIPCSSSSTSFSTGGFRGRSPPTSSLSSTRGRAS